MSKTLFYEIEVSQSDKLGDIEKILFSIFEAIKFDIISTNLNINSILQEFSNLKHDSVTFSIYITNTLVQVVLHASEYEKYFNFKHTQDITQEYIKHLKDDVAVASNFFALSEIKSREELEKVLEQKVAKLNKKLFNSAYFDELTSLSNRGAFFDKLESVISLCRRKDTSFSLMFLDLDGFKYVNDYYGHDVGDVVLKSVALRLTEILREHDFVARLGGDEFVVLLEEYGDEQNLALIAQKIIDAIEENIYYKDSEKANVSASIGIAIYPKDGDCKEDIIKHADISMYEVKKSGKGNYLFFNEQIKKEFQQKKEIENDLDGALERGEFFLLYQPKIDTKNNTLVGVEALIRWQHPRKGIIPNYQWIPVMENSKYLYDIGLYVLEVATSTIAKFNEEQSTQIYVSVNADIKDILSDEYISALRNMQKSKRETLIIELLERDAIEHFDAMILRVDEFKELGVKLSFDDFGTGSTSLSYLSQISPDELKIDRSFVSNIHRSKNQYIVQAILFMAKGFNISVIAEGVETKEELEILNKMGCYLVQGFYFSKPISIEELSVYSI